MPKSHATRERSQGLLLLLPPLLLLCELIDWVD
jgi:hypothetical protein